ncbi:MAG: tetratricopeptide repeat protein [Bacteroidota bacterium]
MKIAILLPIFLFAGNFYCRAQGQDTDIKYRLAQSYERSGDYEAATKFYETMYAADSTNYIVFDALRRMYLQLKRYDDAITLINRRLALQPDDITLLSQLGRVYNLNSNETKADELWERAIASSPKSEATYRVVCSAMLESRLFDKAIKMYLRGRTAIGNGDLFTSDLAYLYTMVLNYTEATREYLNLLKNDVMQMSYVQSRISYYTGRPDGLAAATKVVEERSKLEPDNILVLSLLGWLYMEGKNFDTSFDVFKQIDDKMKAAGLEMENFGERALKERAYATAARAFQYVITTYPKFNMMPQVKFGYARALEESGATRDTLNLFGDQNPFYENSKPANEAQPGFTGAVAEYKKIVADYPGTEIAARSLLQIARMMYNRFDNLNEAHSALENIRTKYAGFIPVVMDAQLLSGDVYLTMGDLDKAKGAYGSVLEFRTVTRDLQDKASYNLAELLYFNGKFSEAILKFQDLTKNASADITNDAIEILLFLQENLKADSAALKEYSKADLQQHQRKYAEALAQYELVKKNYPTAGVVDEALMNMGDLLTIMKRYPEAVANYDTLIKNYPESIVLDKAIMKEARIYAAGLNDKAKAIAAYEALLQRFPNSIYISEARKQIRELRGDSL